MDEHYKLINNELNKIVSPTRAAGGWMREKEALRIAPPALRAPERPLLRERPQRRPRRAGPSEPWSEPPDPALPAP